MLSKTIGDMVNATQSAFIMYQIPTEDKILDRINQKPFKYSVQYRRNPWAKGPKITRTVSELGILSPSPPHPPVLSLGHPSFLYQCT